jgi:hypothetical protein
MNGRTFPSLDHLNEMAMCWLAETADVRVHRETKRRPINSFAEEKPLSACFASLALGCGPCSGALASGMRNVYKLCCFFLYRSSAGSASAGLKAITARSGQGYLRTGCGRD